MNDAEKTEIKEYIDRALVTGKADASNMADHILKKLDTGLNTGIEKYVNGNLREFWKNRLQFQNGYAIIKTKAEISCN